MTPPPDLVYPLKVSGECDEFRYSLRSIRANAPGLYGDIWVVTTEDPPAWLRGVGVINAGAPAGRDKASDVQAKLRAAASHPAVADEFLIMCDDFYLVDKVEVWEPFHMGPTSKYIEYARSQGASRAWLRGITDTAGWMHEQGYGDILARQGHRPLVWDKRLLAEALSDFPSSLQLDVNGLYDRAGAGGVGRRGINSKINSTSNFHEKVANRDIPWLSSSDKSFSEGLIGGYIRALFQDPSPYEEG